MPAGVGLGKSGNLWSKPRLGIPFPEFWRGYWDVTLSGLVNGQPCPPLPSLLHPQIILAPSGTIVADSTGISNGMALRFTPPSGLIYDPFSAFLNGAARPITVMARIRHAVESFQVAWGAGRSTSATQDFHEGFRSAAGFLGHRKDAVGEATVSVISATSENTDVGLEDYIVGWTSDGVQSWIFANGAIEPFFPQPFVSLPIAVNQFAFGSAYRSSLLFSLDGWMQKWCISDQFAPVEPNGSCEIISTMSAYWSTPTIVGFPIWFLGDSLTQGSTGDPQQNGFRKIIWQHGINQSYGLDFIGVKQNGTFIDNQHGGYSGFNLSNIRGVANSLLGSGKPYNGVRIIFLLAGTNNMGIGATAFNNPGTMNDYANLINTIVTLEPNVILVVSTLPAINPATFPGPSANINTFNAALPPIWNAVDALPSRVGNPLLRWNANLVLGGPGHVAANYFDAVHPNTTGYALMAGNPGAVNSILWASDAALASL